MFIAEDRAGRPNDFVAPSGDDELPESAAGACPFCEGHESQTPPSLLEVPADGGWGVRVIPNKYPAVLPGAELGGSVGLAFPAEASVGTQEVLIESPRHLASLIDLGVDEIATVLGAWAERLAAVQGDPGVRYALIFKNEGYAAGASLHHVHSQLLALPWVPPQVEAELGVAQQHREEQGGVLLLEVLGSELELGQRVVAEDELFVALSAQAARQPFELLVVPRRHAPRFTDATAEERLRLAELLRRLLMGMRGCLSPLSFNLILKSAPIGDRWSSGYQWHLEIVPRSCRLAGFEWGTGLFINPLSPERAADELLRCLSEGAAD